MNILYIRVSTLEQNLDRQKIHEGQYDYLVEDRCSGSIPFFDRNGGKEIKNLIDKGVVKQLSVLQIDRLGRDLRDIINTIHYCTLKSICIHFTSQGLRTLNEDGKENPIAKMIIGVLGVVAEMERNQIRERQLEGIKIAKIKGVYLGRKVGSSENTHQFLSKARNRRAMEYIKKGYKNVEVAKLAGLHFNTISKIKRLMVQG